MTQDGYVEGWSSNKRKGKLPVDTRKSQRSFICLCPGNSQRLSFLCELGSLNPTVSSWHEMSWSPVGVKYTVPQSNLHDSTTWSLKTVSQAPHGSFLTSDGPHSPPPSVGCDLG